MKTTMKSFLFALIFTVQILPQEYLEKQFTGYRSPDELITLSANVSFNQAVALLSKVSESVSGKRILSTVDLDQPIGIEINNMAYDKALIVLIQYAGLTYEEKEDVVIIKRKNEAAVDRSSENYASVETREVKISALFFEMDVSESKKRGIDWKILLSKKGLDVGGEIIGNEQEQQTTSGGQSSIQKPPDFNLNASSDFDLGGFFGEATAMFKFFEDENIGEIIANPSIIVRDRNKGRIQVGSDFSIKQRDFAGNIIETFFPTGTIIEVAPYVYKEDEINYMLLKILVERSSFSQGELTTEIRKSNATTQVVMLNGEETVLGGLFVNDESKIRTGIPILKDLPWWFFGLKYLFGSDETVVRKRELVILIKAELLPSLKERIAGKPSDNILKDEVYKRRKDIKYYRLNQTDINE
jgi:type IV pilus assembly protein PilQ